MFEELSYRQYAVARRTGATRIRSLHAMTNRGELSVYGGQH